MSETAVVVKTIKRNTKPRGLDKVAKGKFINADLAAARAIKELDIPGGLIFEITGDSISEIIKYPCETYRAEYTAADDETTHHLLVNIEVLPNDESKVLCYAMWYKEADGKYEIYNPKTDEWVQKDEFSALCKMIRASDGVRELLNDIAAPNGFPEQLKAKQAKKLILNNEKLITLRDAIGDMVQIVVRERDIDKDDISGLSALIIPAPDAPRGFAVFMDDQEYCLCQYLAIEDAATYKYCTTGKPAPECIPHGAEDFINPVFMTSDADKIKQIVLRLVAEEEALFSFPLSEGASGAADFLGGPCMVKGNKGPLTEEERKQLETIESAMDVLLDCV